PPTSSLFPYTTLFRSYHLTAAYLFLLLRKSAVSRRLIFGRSSFLRPSLVSRCSPVICFLIQKFLRIDRISVAFHIRIVSIASFCAGLFIITEHQVEYRSDPLFQFLRIN